uniref:RRM domain-containing protein n=5 Tax=Triticinae TaxID=1648030 RepID=A0A453JSB7_AEGTS
GHSHQHEWTPVVLECKHIRKPDGTPLQLHLHCRPNRPRTNAHQQHPTNTTTTTTDRSRVPPEAGATKVVRLTKMLSPDDCLEDDEFEDLVEDVTEEARTFGNLVKVVIPRPSPGSNPAVAGVGKAFLEYACLDSSSHCRRSMDRMWFAGRRIAAGFYPEDMFAAGDYGYDVHCPEDDG